MAVHYAPAGKDVKGENGLVLKVEQTGGAPVQPFRTEDCSKGWPVLVAPGFGETGRRCSSITALLLMQFLFL